MSRSHFVLIAQTIKTLPSFEIRSYDKKKIASEDAVRFSVIASSFADALRSTNPNFNRERFLDACGGK
jgi:hypothetical protein